MLDQETIEKTILSYEGSKKSFPYEKGLAVFSYNDDPFILMSEGSEPLRLTLRCDEKLGKVLGEKYESVMPAKKMNPKKWIDIILSGQLQNDEVQSLLLHAYLVVKEAV